jgi:hypothetical protein
MNYHHPSGEVHIMENNQWVSCPGKKSISGMTNKEGNGLLAINFTIGQDNTSKKCSVGDVRDVLDGNVTHHSGPFDGVIMGVGC